MKELILLRGLPGAGKSTLAAILAEDNYPIFSVDDYFTDKKTGAYAFDYRNNHIAYSECEQNTRRAMQQQEKKIFVHNTFTLEWELEPYFKLAGEFGYRVFVATVEKRHSAPNIHAIPDEQLRKMAEKYKVVLL
jgi:predicted kinase